MTIDQIAALATSGQSETLEFKEDRNAPRGEHDGVRVSEPKRRSDAVRHAESGAVVGQQVSERTIEELSAELRQIEPPAFGKRRQVVMAIHQRVPFDR